MSRRRFSARLSSLMGVESVGTTAEFAAFVGGAELRLRRALVATYGVTVGRDAVSLERLSTPPAERRAEDTRVDDQPHDVTAAANASSSSSVRPSISKASTESRTGAASNSSDVRSRGNKLVPCGTSRRSFAASLTAKLYRRSRWRTSRESIGRCVNNLIRANSWRRAPPQRSRLVALSQVPAEWRRHNNGLAEDLHRRSSWVNYGGPPVS